MKLRIACMVSGFLSLVVSMAAQTSGSSPASAQVPPLIQFSNVATDEGGNTLSGVVNLTFSLYAAQQGGEPLWTETQNNVPLDPTGHYSVQLGITKPGGVPTTLFTTGEARWLGVQIAQQPEQPRALLLSVPYALKAGDAATVGGLPPSAFVLAAPPNGTAPVYTTDSVTGQSVSPETAVDVTTTGGTANYLPFFNGASTIIDSLLFQSGGKVGINTITPGATLDVKGTANVEGLLTLPATGPATASGGRLSQGQEFVASSYNSSTPAAVNQTFELRAEPVGNNTASPSATLSVLFGSGTAAPAETGLKIASNGQLTFATGQKFPGTGTLTGITTAAGSGLSGGGTTGTLSLKVPAAGITNALLANSKITLNANAAGGITTPGTMSLGSTYTIGLKPCTANQILQFSGSVWACASAGTGTVTSIATGLGLTGGPITGSGTLSINATVVPQLGASNTFTGNQTVIGTFGVTGNGNNLLVGDPGCGSGFAGFGFLPSGGLSGCVNYALLGDSTGGTYINSGMGATIHFRNYNSELATIDSSGNVNVFGKNGGGNMTVAGVLTVSGNQAVSSGPGGSFTGYSAPSGSGLNGTDGIVSTGGNGDLTLAPGAYGGAGVAGTGGQGIGGFSGAGGPGPGGSFVGGDSSNCEGCGGDGVDGTAGLNPGGGTTGYAGNFNGDLNVSGIIFAGTKDFKIDHPLDPANKYLVHASVESSEMMNIYTGNVTTDAQGQAAVQLPEWFEVLNADFRYQLTVIGQFAQAIVAREIEHNQFEIRTSAPNVKVSWQVTGVRQDAFAKANPLVVEQEKEERLRGFYIHPELYGAPPEKQIEWARHPQMMQRMKEVRAKQQAALKAEVQH